LCIFVLAAAALPPSCAAEKPAAIPFSGFGETTLLTLTPAVELRLSEKPETLRFRFDPPVTIADGLSLEAEYSFQPADGAQASLSRYRIAAEIGGDLWELPPGADFLPGGGEADNPDAGLVYAVPLNPGVLSQFSIRAIPDTDASSVKTAAPGVWTLRSLKLVPRWYGFDLSPKDGGRPLLKFTPFLALEDGASLIISPSAEYNFNDAPEITLAGVKGSALISAGRKRLEYRPPGGSLAARNELLIPQGALPGGIFPVTLSAADRDAVLSLTSFVTASGPRRPFPAPIPADPGLILSYPVENWRSPAYEVFRWPAFPEILIIDAADYAVQARLFKRLAFFVEKRGYRGRLVPNRELEGLHGWNAHDYRAGDLARFFEAARLSAFPLLDEERALCSLLLENGVIHREPDGALVPGAGAVLSISRESSDYLRGRFMIHECFHGLFFIDGDFRDFSAARWENLLPEARRFFISCLDSMSYDTADPYLTVNEFMSYCLQQPVAEAPHYFGEYLPGQIAANPLRRAALPADERRTPDGRRLWPVLARAFTQEAEAFSAYASRRWGFSAGMIYSVYPVTGGR
jgi:hypothetical protein